MCPILSEIWIATIGNGQTQDWKALTFAVARLLPFSYLSFPSQLHHGKKDFHASMKRLQPAPGAEPMIPNQA